MKYLLLVLLALAACTTQRNPEVCCTTDADCARLGVEPRGCADGFVCTNFTCTAAQCDAATDCTAAAPVCDQATATCSGCASSADCASYADAPVCDAASGACRGCTADAECPSDVCDLDAGRCVDAAEVVYASPTGSADAACSRTNPCSAQRAITVAGASPEGTVVRMLPGIYVDPISVTGPPARNIVATDATLQGSLVSLDIGAGATVRIRGIFTAPVSQQIECEGTVSAPARLVLDRSRLDAYTNVLAHCTLRVTRSSVPREYGTVIYLRDDASLEVDRTHFKGTNGTLRSLGSRIRARVTNSVFDGVGLLLASNDVAPDRSEYFFAFNTMVGNAATGSVVQCSQDLDPSRLFVFENNIIANAANRNAAYFGRGCTFAGNVFWPQQPAISGTNLTADPRFVDLSGRDLRLSTESPARDRAVMSTGPETDHDFLGTPRPQGPAKDVGAYELAP